MTAEIISIGTELLLGQIVDTDAAYLAQQLSLLGISIYHRQTVGDNLQRAIEAAQLALGRADLLILIGGLGPTMDDLTRDVIASVAQAPLIRDAAIAQSLKDLFAERGYTLSDTILRQADVPFGAVALPNANGTAPGLLLDKNGKTMVALPGPPNELIPLFETSVYPVLRERMSGAPAFIRSKTLRIVGMGESVAEEKAADLMQDSNPTVAPYAKLAEVHLRVTAKAETEVAANAMVAERAALVRERIGDFIYGEDETTLEASVVALLKANQRRIATAESCTGGMLAGRITAVAGSSAVFQTGLVTYSNEAKVHLLKIPQALVSQRGAVSHEVAQTMAERVREMAESEYGIGITGIAGPDGGTAEKPVGLVYIALATPTRTEVRRELFGGQRADVRYRATQVALDMLRRALLTEA